MTSVSIDRDRLVDWASKAISIPSFTGSEEELARFVQATFEELGLQGATTEHNQGQPHKKEKSPSVPHGSCTLAGKLQESIFARRPGTSDVWARPKMGVITCRSAVM